MAWSLVKEETIRKCFRKAGVLGNDMEVVVREEDPFSDADECERLKEFIKKTISGQDACPFDEYLDGESDLPTCSDLDDATWEEISFSHLKEAEGEEEVSLETSWKT